MTRSYSHEYLAQNQAYARRTKANMLYKRRAFHGCRFRAAWPRFCLAGSRNRDVTDTRVRLETTPVNISPKTRPTRARIGLPRCVSAGLSMDAAFAPLGHVSVSPVRGIWT